MAETKTLRAKWADDTWKLIFDKQNDLQKKKLRKITPAQAIEVLMKDAYLRKDAK